MSMRQVGGLGLPRTALDARFFLCYHNLAKMLMLLILEEKTSKALLNERFRRMRIKNLKKTLLSK